MQRDGDSRLCLALESAIYNCLCLDTHHSATAVLMGRSLK